MFLVSQNAHSINLCSIQSTLYIKIIISVLKLKIHYFEQKIRNFLENQTKFVICRFKKMKKNFGGQNKNEIIKNMK